MEESSDPGDKLKGVTEKVKGALGGLLGGTHKSQDNEQEEGAGAGDEGFFGVDDAAHRGTGVYGEASDVDSSHTVKVGFMDKVKDTLTGQTPSHGTAAGTATTGDGTGYGTSRSTTAASDAAGGVTAAEGTRVAGAADDATRGSGGGGPEAGTTLAGADSRQAAGVGTGMFGHDTRSEQEREPTNLASSGDRSASAQGYSSSSAAAPAASTLGSTEARAQDGWPRPTKPATFRDAEGNVHQTPGVKQNVKKEGVLTKILEKLHLHSPKKGPSGSPAA